MILQLVNYTPGALRDKLGKVAPHGGDFGSIRLLNLGLGHLLGKALYSPPASDLPPQGLGVARHIRAKPAVVDPDVPTGLLSYEYPSGSIQDPPTYERQGGRPGEQRSLRPLAVVTGVHKLQVSKPGDHDQPSQRKQRQQHFEATFKHDLTDSLGASWEVYGTRQAECPPPR
jgi:hypothetical protein